MPDDKPDDDLAELAATRAREYIRRGGSVQMTAGRTSEETVITCTGGVQLQALGASDGSPADDEE